MRLTGSLSIVAAYLERSASIVGASGTPVTSTMRSIWLIVEEPASSGLPMNLSAMMHPSAHTSTARVYDVEPSRISGARYHRVAT